MIRTVGMVGVLGILAAAFAPPAPHPVVLSGYRYQFATSGEGIDAITGTTQVAGTQARIDMDGHSDPQFILVDNATHTITLVSPEKREYSVVADSTFQRLVGSVLNALPMVSVRLSGATVTGTRLGAGEAIAGHPTRRYQLVQDFTVTLGAFGIQAARNHQRVTTEYWMATDLVLPANPIITVLAQITTALAQTDRDFAHRTAEELRPVAQGTPLKITVHSESQDDKGKTASKTETLQVTSIARATIDPAQFSVPDGFTRKDPQFTGKIF